MIIKILTIGQVLGGVTEGLEELLEDGDDLALGASVDSPVEDL